MHVAAALARLPKVVRYRDKDMVKTDVVIPKGSGIRAEAPVDGAVLRQLGSERAGALAGKLCAMIPGHTHRMFPRQAANCVWALGTLNSMGVTVPEAGRGAGENGRRPRGARGGEVSPPLAVAGAPTDNDPSFFKDTLEGMVARIEAAGMSHGFAHAYASLLEVVSADAFRAMESHGQPVEAAQLLKGESRLPDSSRVSQG